jgi:hypothetical protein
MYRASLIASVVAMVVFAWAQARGMDPTNMFSGSGSHTSTPYSSGHNTYHK